jgi:hypothetical protein
MSSIQVKILTVISLIALSSAGGLVGCESARIKPVRNPASADETLIRKFAETVAKEAGIGDEAAVEEVITQVVNENSEKLSVAKIRTFDDITELSDREQKRILNQLTKIPALAEKLGLKDLDPVIAARREAITSMQEVKSVSTEAVPDLHAVRANGASDSEIRFTKILQRSPELKDDVALMVRENKYIEEKTGIAVLAKGCDGIQNPESVENVATVITGVQRDVASGEAKDTPGVAKSLEKNMGYTLGTDSAESHHRVCTLSDANQCGVFTPAMCR